jgi:hypothetical protein
VINGFGTMFYCVNQKFNGKYEGGWLDGKKHGCGVFTFLSQMKVIKHILFYFKILKV